MTKSPIPSQAMDAINKLFATGETVSAKLMAGYFAIEQAYGRDNALRALLIEHAISVNHLKTLRQPLSDGVAGDQKV